MGTFWFVQILSQRGCRAVLLDEIDGLGDVWVVGADPGDGELLEGSHGDACPSGTKASSEGAIRLYKGVKRVF